MKSGFFSMRSARFPRQKRDNWRDLIPKSAWRPVKRVVRRKPPEPEPVADEPVRQYPITSSKTGKTLVFRNREDAMRFIQDALDALIEERWSSSPLDTD